MPHALTVQVRVRLITMPHAFLLQDLNRIEALLSVLKCALPSRKHGQLRCMGTFPCGSAAGHVGRAVQNACGESTESRQQSSNWARDCARRLVAKECQASCCPAQRSGVPHPPLPLGMRSYCDRMPIGIAFPGGGRTTRVRQVSLGSS